MLHSALPKKLRINCIRETVLGVDVLRGYARLCDLSLISKADVYDAKSNPTGTQRDLSPKHAREAYLYIRQEDKAYWPEIFLCARRSEVWSFDCLNDKVSSVGELIIDTQIAKEKEIAVSRVDGNHRLHFAGGDYEGYPAIEKLVSFSLAVGLSLADEMRIFRDINNNQRRMNTSHLANIEVKLTGESALKIRDPKLYIANQLSLSKDSPFKGVVYDGGKKDVAKFVPLNTLKTGVEYMLSQPTRLSAIDDPDIQFKLISNYFKALRSWAPHCWVDPKKHVMLRGAGLWGVCFLGAEVIDRVLRKGNFRQTDMLEVLKSGKEWDWTSKGHFAGLSGRGGALKIRDMISAELEDDEGVSLKSLMQDISKEI